MIINFVLDRGVRGAQTPSVTVWTQGGLADLGKNGLWKIFKGILKKYWGFFSICKNFKFIPIATSNIPTRTSKKDKLSVLLTKK